MAIRRTERQRDKLQTRGQFGRSAVCPGRNWASDDSTVKESTLRKLKRAAGQKPDKNPTATTRLKEETVAIAT